LEGIDEMVEIRAAVALSTALGYDFTLVSPPLQDQVVDHFKRLLLIPSTVRH
jgi:hypothetical protein